MPRYIRTSQWFGEASYRSRATVSRASADLRSLANQQSPAFTLTTYLSPLLAVWFLAKNFLDPRENQRSDQTVPLVLHLKPSFICLCHFCRVALHPGIIYSPVGSIVSSATMQLSLKLNSPIPFGLHLT